MTTEDCSATSSASECPEKIEAMKAASDLLAQGKKNVVCGELPKAVGLYEEAVQLLVKSCGEMSRECADAYFCCGSALLELGRMETNVLGAALEGVEVEEEKEEEVNEQFEKPPADEGEEREKLRVEVYRAMAEGDREEEFQKVLAQPSTETGHVGICDTALPAASMETDAEAQHSEDSTAVVVDKKHLTNVEAQEEKTIRASEERHPEESADGSVGGKKGAEKVDPCDRKCEDKGTLAVDKCPSVNTDGGADVTEKCQSDKIVDSDADMVEKCPSNDIDKKHVSAQTLVVDSEIKKIVVTEVHNTDCTTGGGEKKSPSVGDVCIEEELMDTTEKSESDQIKDAALVGSEGKSQEQIKDSAAVAGPVSNNQEGTGNIKHEETTGLAEQDKSVAVAEQDKCVAVAEQDKSVAVAEQDKCVAVAEQDKCVAVAEQDKPVAVAEQDKSVAVAEQDKCVAVAEQDKPVAVAEQDKCVAVAEQDKPVAVAEQDKPVAVAEQDKSVAVAEQDKPVAVAEQDKPVAVAEQDKCVAVAEQDKPVAVAEQDKPVAVAEQDKSVAVAEQDKPVAVPEQDKPVAVAEQDKPVAVAEQDKCVAVAEQDKPVAVAEQDKCVAVPEQDKPVAVPEQDKCVAVAEQDKPVAVAEQDKPVAVAEQDKCVAVAEQDKPVAVPEQDKPVAVAEQDKPVAVAEQDKPVAIPEQDKPVAVAEQNKSMEDKDGHVEKTGTVTVTPLETASISKLEVGLNEQPLSDSKQVLAEAPVADNDGMDVGEDETDDDEEEEMTNANDIQESEGTEEEKEEVPNFQLAWEYLDLAKVLYLKSETGDDQLKAAQCHLKLGELSMETGQHATAIEDLGSALTIQQKHLPSNDRLIAETLYQLGLAYGFSGEYEKSAQHYMQAIGVIESKIESLSKMVQEKEINGENKENAELGECARYLDEIKELQQLIPDIKIKIEDTNQEAKDVEQMKKSEAKETLSSGQLSETTGSPAKSIEPAAADKTGQTGSLDGSVESGQVSDIAHLVRKKRKPESDLGDAVEVKKIKSDGDCSNDTSTNHETNEKIVESCILQAKRKPESDLGDAVEVKKIKSDGDCSNDTSTNHETNEKIVESCILQAKRKSESDLGDAVEVKKIKSDGDCSNDTSTNHETNEKIVESCILQAKRKPESDLGDAVEVKKIKSDGDCSNDTSTNHETNEKIVESCILQAKEDSPAVPVEPVA